MDRQPVRLISAAVAVCTIAALSACSSPDAQDPAQTSQNTQSAPPTQETTSESPQTSTTQASSESTTPASQRDAKEVEEIAQHFSTLAPAEFFDKLTSCTEADLEGSFDCSGAEIGQFQFFDSDSKAASTTQLLTELRGSRVVEDSGERVVGWSTLGTSAVITVVDNEAGQVMQQLVSSDREDPRERIVKLGLAQEPLEGEADATAPAN